MQNLDNGKQSGLDVQVKKKEAKKDQDKRKKSLAKNKEKLNINQVSPPVSFYFADQKEKTE